MVLPAETGPDLSQPNGLDGSPKYLEKAEILPHDCVLIVGGGPVGLSLATVLSHYGVKSIVLERNETTTRYDASCHDISWHSLIYSQFIRWPKMDLTNVRSMELFRKLGLAEGLRRRGQFVSTSADACLPLLQKAFLLILNAPFLSPRDSARRRRSLNGSIPASTNIGYK